jgi:hypothetical protein
MRPVLLTAAAAALGFCPWQYLLGAEATTSSNCSNRWIVYRNYFNDGCITTLYKYFDGKEFKSQI